MALLDSETAGGARVGRDVLGLYIAVGVCLAWGMLRCPAQVVKLSESASVTLIAIALSLL